MATEGVVMFKNRELNTIREHDHKATLQAEKAYEELARTVQESEMNAT